MAHNFALLERVEEPGIPSQWHRVRAVCLRCHEERLVYHAVDMRDLNRGWCTRDLTLDAFLLDRFREDDGDRTVAAWRLVLRPFVLAIMPGWMKQHMATRHANHPDYRQEWRP